MRAITTIVRWVFLMVKFFSLLFIVLFGSLSAGELPDDPLRIVSTEGHFSVTFPAGFSHAAKEEESVETEVGSISTVNYVSFNDTSVAMAGAGSYPDAITNHMSSSSGQLFALAEESLMISLGGTVIKSETLKGGDYPGREIEFTAQMDDMVLIGRARFLFDGKRLFSVIFISSDLDSATENEIKDFFNSFVINTAL